MNTPEYKKAYLANLKIEIKNNNTNFNANITQPAMNQYIQNSGQSVLGSRTHLSNNAQSYSGNKGMVKIYKK